MKGARRLLFNVLGVLVGCLLIYVVVEGACSALLLAWDLGFKTVGGLRSGKYVQFDDELGWVGAPGTHLADFSGPGRDITIDARSLRITAPPDDDDSVTVLCSGDSFTFGVGVGDTETWCYRLGVDHPRLATLNAGEPAYGLGQMYLKAARLADDVNWDVQVFAFIADDIRRMTTSEFVGRNKPRFVLDDAGALKLERDRVAESSRVYAWVRANKRVFANLRVLELSDRIRQKMAGPPAPRPSDDETARLAGAIFEQTAKLNAEKGRRAVFVFLPGGADVDPADTAWRPRIAAECKRRGLHCAELVTPFRALSDADQEGMFEPVTNHYNARGNAWIAERIAGLVRTATTASGSP